MDLITQGVLGAAVTQAALGPKQKKAWWLGALGGLAPDLDVLIRSGASPMLGLIYHRHFTHSLFFIPIGALLVALPWMYRQRKEPGAWRFTLAATTIGYATHAILDAFTSYGTLLWWPASHERVAWSVIAIVDPRYTLPLILGIWASARSQTRRWVLLALAWSVAYMGLCGWQRHQALELQSQLIAARHHRSDKREVFPQMGSARRWRSIYRVKDRAFVDELWMGWINSPKIAVGTSTPLLRTSPPPSKPGPTDEHTLHWFGKTWLYEAKPLSEHRRWCDGRLSLRADAFDPVFCFEMDEKGRAVAKAPLPPQSSLGQTLRQALWPSPALRPAKDVLREAEQTLRPSLHHASL